MFIETLVLDGAGPGSTGGPVLGAQSWEPSAEITLTPHPVPAEWYYRQPQNNIHWPTLWILLELSLSLQVLLIKLRIPPLSFISRFDRK